MSRYVAEPVQLAPLDDAEGSFLLACEFVSLSFDIGLFFVPCMLFEGFFCMILSQKLGSFFLCLLLMSNFHSHRARRRGPMNCIEIKYRICK